MRVSMLRVKTWQKCKKELNRGNNYQLAIVSSVIRVHHRCFLFQRMLEFDPTARVTAVEALDAEYFAGEKDITRLDSDRIGDL